MAQHPTTEMAYKSIRVLQTVIIPTDLLSDSPPVLPNHQTMKRVGSRRQKETDRGNTEQEIVLESKIVRQRSGETALERQRQRD